MEEQLAQLLAGTQASKDGIRMQAELELKHAQSNPAFPLSLANVASITSLTVDIRQSALTYLRRFIERNWGGEDVSGPAIPIDASVREQIRSVLLDLSLNSEDRKIKAAASYAVGKIANVDFPDQWPTLIPTVLAIIPSGNDVQFHGALKVLEGLVEDSLSDDQFFSVARDIVGVMYEAVLNESRKPLLRAFAVSVFSGCFAFLEMVKEDHPQEVTSFVNDALKGWFPFFLQIIKLQLPDQGSEGANQPDSWNGIIALKLQSVKCLLRVKAIFPTVLLPETPHFFEAVWEELSRLEGPHERMYIENEAQGRLEDSDGLPYTLDMLVLEELDFLNGCIKAPPVRKELESQLQSHGGRAHETPWVLSIIKLAASYARITREGQDLWAIDVSLYLAEEASVSANYAPRTASGDLLIKLGEWLNQGALEGLYAYTKSLFSGEPVSWRLQESSLYLLNVMVGDLIECSKPVHPEIVQAYVDIINYAVRPENDPLLRGRGHLVGGVLAQVNDAATGMMPLTIEAITSDDSEIVQVACIKAIEGFIKSDDQGNKYGTEVQAKVVQAISQWISSQDMTDLEEADDLLVSLAETLRAAINLDKRIAISSESPALDLLFLIAKHGANNWQVTMMICESFEDLVQSMSDPASYQALCEKTLPSLTSTFDVAKVTADNPLLVFATELMAALTQYASEPLPPGFVGTVLPKLNRLLMESTEGEILRPGVESVKYLLAHDHEQMFNYSENGRSGLEICLHIIDRLLGSGIEDNAASEVGGLAAELVEKAGHARLGPYLPQLLQAVANRLSTAWATPFIQSLILVFARLSINGAPDVVEFLSTFQIGDKPALQLVLSKWLDNSVNFAGYDEIRQNIIALSKLYSLSDPRIEQTMVKGDLIIVESDKIMTRSRAKQNPDQYTTVPAPLKILKVLIEELLIASGAHAASNAAAAAATNLANEDNDDDGWEDDPDTIDLTLGSTKNDLMGYLENSDIRNRDDETQTYLVDFFVTAARDNVAKFGEWYNNLTEDEKMKLSTMANMQQ